MQPRLGVRLAATTALVVLLGSASASAAHTPRTVPLTVRVTGSGVIRLPGRSLTCRVACSDTFQIPRGRRIAVTATAATGWKLTKWSGACRGSDESCSLRLNRQRSAAVRFVPPGNHLNPYPMGTAVTTSGGWTVRVNSATLNADSQIEAVNSQPPPPPGDQYTLVNLTMTSPVGGGPFDLGDFLFNQQQMQASAKYAPDSCEPPQPDLGTVRQVSSGTTMTGNLCYEIATNDAATLRLTGYVETGTNDRQVWFALR
jgi:List-Bact-rpt repeat protein